MGACATITKQRKTNPQTIAFPVFTILFKTSSILKLSAANNFEQSPLTLPDVLPNDISYRFVPPDTLYILGGSDSSNSLRNEVFKLTLSSRSIEYLPSLPINSKLGEVHCVRSTLYYIGGVRLYSGNCHPTPFLRLPPGNNTWEMLEESPRAGKMVSISTQLYRPGSCVVNGDIFIVGGEVFIPNYARSRNKSVYTLNVNTLVISRMDILGVDCVGPKCFGYQNNSVLVLGNNEGNQGVMQIIGELTSRPKEIGFKVKDCMNLQRLGEDIVIVRRRKTRKLKEDNMIWKCEKINMEKINILESINNVVNEKPRTELHNKVAVISSYYGENEKEENSGLE